MTSALLRGPAGSPGRAVPDLSSYEPGLLVDQVIRLLVDARVPLAIGSISRAHESATRLLRDLGVAPAPMSPNRAYWYGVADAIRDQAVDDSGVDSDVPDDRSSDVPSGTPRRPRRAGGRR